MTFGGFNTTILKKPRKIHWYKSYGDSNQLFIESVRISNTIIDQSNFGLRTEINLNEEALLVSNRVWSRVEKTLKETNNFLNCNEWKCTYSGNCNDLGLSSIFITMLDGTQFEIVKNQYLK